MAAIGSIGVKQKERRRADRSSKTGKVTISWTLDGRERVAQAELVDLSATGIRFCLRDPLPIGTAIRFRVDPMHLHGSAKVRHYVQKGLRYTVGAEFLGGLVWKDQ